MHSIVQCETNPVHQPMKSKHDSAYVRTVGIYNTFFFLNFIFADANGTHSEVTLHFAAANSSAYPMILELI